MAYLTQFKSKKLFFNETRIEPRKISYKGFNYIVSQEIKAGKVERQCGGITTAVGITEKYVGQRSRKCSLVTSTCMEE